MRSEELKSIENLIDCGNYTIHWKNLSYRCVNDGGVYMIYHNNGTGERLREAHEYNDFFTRQI